MSCVQSVLDPADWSNDLLITIHVDEGFHHVLELGIVLSVSDGERQLGAKGDGGKQVLRKGLFTCLTVFRGQLVVMRLIQLVRYRAMRHNAHHADACYGEHVIDSPPTVRASHVHAMG